MAKKEIATPDEFLEGTEHKSNQGSVFVVEKYNRAVDIDIRFCDSGHTKKVTADSIRKGKVSDPFFRSASGIGYMGVGRFNSMNSQKASQVWRGILHRCYSENKHEKFKRNYHGCTVSCEWQNFQNFAEWYYGKYVEGYEVDKDLLYFGNKVYSERTCILIPQWLNAFVASAKAIRGESPVGVSERKGKNDFEAYCNDSGKRVHLGIYSTKEAAHNAWMSKKLSIALKNKHLMDDIDKRIYPNVVKIIETMA